MDLLYTDNQKDFDELKNLFSQKYPKAKLEDASDGIHPYRFSIGNIEYDDDYLMFLCESGCLENSLASGLKLQNPDKEASAMVQRVLRRLKEKHDANKKEG